MVFRHLARRFDAPPAARPVAFACVTQTLKTTITDVAVQLGVERRETPTNCAAIEKGHWWMDAAQYYISSACLTRSPAKTAVTAAAKVALDHPSTCRSSSKAFYTVDAVVRREELRRGGARPLPAARSGGRVSTRGSSPIAAQFVGFRFVPCISSYRMSPAAPLCWAATSVGSSGWRSGRASPRRPPAAPRRRPRRSGGEVAEDHREPDPERSAPMPFRAIGPFRLELLESFGIRVACGPTRLTSLRRSKPSPRFLNERRRPTVAAPDPAPSVFEMPCG